MKLVMALIKPHKLEPLHRALVEIGVAGHAASEVKGFYRKADHAEVHRGTEYSIPFMPMVKIEAVVADDMVERVIVAIRQAAGTDHLDDGTDHLDDGSIVVCEAREAISIHSGDADGAAH